MAPFYGWGSTASRLEPLQGGSLLFTTKFPISNQTFILELVVFKEDGIPWPPILLVKWGNNNHIFESWRVGGSFVAIAWKIFFVFKRWFGYIAENIAEIFFQVFSG